MKDINAQEYNELLSSESPVVIDFHATWCGPCKVLSPILEELSSEVDGVEFVKLDVDQHPEIAGRIKNHDSQSILKQVYLRLQYQHF